jgi:hypothetical protein
MKNDYKTYIAKYGGWILATSIFISVIGVLLWGFSATRSSEEKNAALESSKRCNIKGNISEKTGEKIYHLPGDKYYDSTKIDTNRGEKMFCSEDEARQAGWRHSKI